MTHAKSCCPDYVLLDWSCNTGCTPSAERDDPTCALCSTELNLSSAQPKRTPGHKEGGTCLAYCPCIQTWSISGIKPKNYCAILNIASPQPWNRSTRSLLPPRRVRSW